jgi:hypothetical protein
MLNLTTRLRKNSRILPHVRTPASLGFGHHDKREAVIFKLRHPRFLLHRRIKNDTIAHYYRCFGPKLSRPGGLGSIWSLKTSKSVIQIAAIKSPSSINQRVNLAIGTAKKIERDSRSKNAKKGFRPFGHRPVEWQFAFCLQQNRRKGGGGGQKFTRRSTFFSRILADAFPMFRGLSSARNCKLLSHTRMISRLAYIRSSVPL